jgi:hypothetical protein
MQIAKKKKNEFPVQPAQTPAPNDEMGCGGCCFWGRTAVRPYVTSPFPMHNFPNGRLGHFTPDVLGKIGLFAN